MKNAKGFTLIELMISLMILGVLAAIAIPSYQSSIRKTHRADAKASLNDIAMKLQRCFTTNSSYLASSTVVCAVSDQLKTSTGITSQYYFVTVGSNITQTTYTLTAQPIAGSSQASDTVCADFFLDQAGTKTAVDASNNDTTSTCW